MATRFKSPVFAELSIYITPATDARPVRVRARRGFFDIEEPLLKAFRKYAKDRPQYRITEVKEAPPVEKPTAHGRVRQAPKITKAERHPETVTSPPDEDDDEAIEALLSAADDEADDDEDVSEDDS